MGFKAIFYGRSKKPTLRKADACIFYDKLPSCLEIVYVIYDIFKSL